MKVSGCCTPTMIRAWNDCHSKSVGSVVWYRDSLFLYRTYSTLAGKGPGLCFVYKCTVWDATDSVELRTYHEAEVQCDPFAYIPAVLHVHTLSLCRCLWQQLWILFCLGIASYLATLGPRWTCWDCTHWRTMRHFPPQSGTLNSHQVCIPLSFSLCMSLCRGVCVEFL